jgi:hypothetical protein
VGSRQSLPLADIREQFATAYRRMIDAVLRRRLPVALCTIYEGRFEDPREQRLAATGLTVFNDVIIREAFARGLPLIDLRYRDRQHATVIECIDGPRRRCVVDRSL